MWCWNGYGWRFISLVGPWYPKAEPVKPPEPSRQTIHEAPVAVPEYLARIREKCD